MNSFVSSAGFGGLCAVLAGLLAYFAARRGAVERRRHDDLQRWWEQFTWTVENVPPDDELLYRLLTRLADSAHHLGDPDMIEYIEEYILDAAGAQFSGEPDWMSVTMDDAEDELETDDGVLNGDR